MKFRFIYLQYRAIYHPTLCIHSVFGVLLHGATWCNYQKWSISTTWCSHAIPLVLSNLHQNGCPIQLFTATTTLHGSLWFNSGHQMAYAHQSQSWSGPYRLYDPGNAQWNMLLWGCQNSWWTGFFSLLTSKTAWSDRSPNVTTQESDATLTVLEEYTLDEEINKEIVDDPNVLTEVKLPACICKFKFLPCSSITQWFIKIEDGLYLMLHICFRNQSFQY